MPMTPRSSPCAPNSKLGFSTHRGRATITREPTSAASGLLLGEIAIVTGASRGLGAETARQLAAAGAKVAVNFLRNKDAADAVVEHIVSAGGAAFAVQADVREPDPTLAMVDAVRARWGDPDILILNADVGGFRPTPFSALSAADYSNRVNNELAAAVVPISAVLPSMTARRSGCVLAISSALCRAPVPGFSLLSTSKAALEALVRSLAVELGPLGIRVNTIEASMIDGDNASVVDETQREHMLRGIPLRRIARPGDIAGVIALIASHAAGFINGASIPINGGQVMY